MASNIVLKSGIFKLQNNFVSKVMASSDTKSKTGRRTLQVLQPAASSSSTQTTLVGGNGALVSRKGLTNKNQLKPDPKPELEANVVKPEVSSTTKPKVETRSIEVQTDPLPAGANLERAEAVAWMTSCKPSFATFALG